jgi:hypothetical protein
MIHAQLVAEKLKAGTGDRGRSTAAMTASIKLLINDPVLPSRERSKLARIRIAGKLWRTGTKADSALDTGEAFPVLLNGNGEHAKSQIALASSAPTMNRVFADSITHRPNQNGASAKSRGAAIACVLITNGGSASATAMLPSHSLGESVKSLVVAVACARKANLYATDTASASRR